MESPTLEQLIEQTERLIAETRQFLNNLHAPQAHHEESLKKLRESLAQMKADLVRRNSN
jgi:hypothetical protein